jgi:hypothetical protein
MTPTEKVLAMDLEHLTESESEYLHELNRRAQLRIVMLYVRDKYDNR